ncbi:MAG: PspC domain-containing protein [Pseudoflavonifractor sp.]|nr:PspC domain-containing protein [Pseudoflavonifractor sp.]
MKRTFPINLSGKVYYIDEDAYTLLGNYLDNIRAAFASPEDSEIADDIEARISELFGEMLSTEAEVITIADVNAVIDRIGRPEDMCEPTNPKADQSGHDSGENRATPPPVPGAAQGTTVRKRLFRDPDDKIFGGVASGIALYLGWNISLVRLVLVLFALLGYGIVIPLYIAAWILIPQAQTADEKLAMYGKPLNLDNIGQTVKEGYNRATAQVRQAVGQRDKNFWDRLVDVIGWVIKIGLVLLAICLLPGVVAILVALLAVVVGLVASLIGCGAGLVAALPWIPVLGMSTPELGFAASVLIFFLITLIALIWGAGCVAFKWRGPSTWVMWTAVILWSASIIGAFTCFAILGFNLPIPA